MHTFYKGQAVKWIDNYGRIQEGKIIKVKEDVIKLERNIIGNMTIVFELPLNRLRKK